MQFYINNCVECGIRIPASETFNIEPDIRINIVRLGCFDCKEKLRSQFLGKVNNHSKLTLYCVT